MQCVQGYGVYEEQEFQRKLISLEGPSTKDLLFEKITVKIQTKRFIFHNDLIKITI